MSWFGSDTVEAVGTTTSKITGGIRHLFTGDIPPEILQELDRMDKEHTTERWKADAMIPWYKSSRSIVLLALTVNWLAMTWLNSSVAEYWVTANVSLMMIVVGGFFGGKSLELINGKKH